MKEREYTGKRDSAGKVFEAMSLPKISLSRSSELSSTWARAFRRVSTYICSFLIVLESFSRLFRRLALDFSCSVIRWTNRSSASFLLLSASLSFSSKDLWMERNSSSSDETESSEVFRSVPVKNVRSVTYVSKQGRKHGR